MTIRQTYLIMQLSSMLHLMYLPSLEASSRLPRTVPLLPHFLHVLGQDINIIIGEI